MTKNEIKAELKELDSKIHRFPKLQIKNTITMEILKRFGGHDGLMMNSHNDMITIDDSR